MDFQEFFQNLPGPNRFLMIMSFLLVIMFLTYRNMRNRAQAEQELKDKLDDLRDTVRQKNNRIEEIHHRIKNNLQMISSMIGLQADDCDDPDLIEGLRRCRSRVHSMAMIHDLLKGAGQEERVEVKAYLERLIYKSIQMRSGNHTGIDVQTDIDSMEVDAETATSCGFLVSELLTNCYQHAFEEVQEGTIDVRYGRINGKVKLVVADDGMGFPAGTIEDPFSSTGHELIRSIASSDLGGTVQFRNTEEGTEVVIEFPANQA